jgi:hypothetical protein
MHPTQGAFYLHLSWRIATVMHQMLQMDHDLCIHAIYLKCSQRILDLYFLMEFCKTEEEFEFLYEFKVMVVEKKKIFYLYKKNKPNCLF